MGCCQDRITELERFDVGFAPTGANQTPCLGVELPIESSLETGAMLWSAGGAAN